MNTEKLLNLIKTSLEDKKAHNINILNVRNLSSITDFMVVATGNTARQVKASAEYVMEQTKGHGHCSLGNEGTNVGEWALVDLGDVIVHDMQPQIRDFYQLEKLWTNLGNDVQLSQ